MNPEGIHFFFFFFRLTNNDFYLRSLSFADDPAGNVFTPLAQSLYLSRGGGVVIAPASRSNKRGLKGKLAGGLRARRGSNPFPGAIF